MDVVKQVVLGENTTIWPASVFSKRIVEKTELSNCIENRDETPEKGLQKVGRNDTSDIVSERTTKNREELK